MQSVLTPSSISAVNIISLLLTGTVCSFGPFAVFMLLRKKHSLKFIPFLAGASIFMLFVLLFERPLNSYLMEYGSAFYSVMVASPSLYMIYSGLFVSVFQDGGRFLTFLLFKNSFLDYRSSISHTFGFGTLEALYPVGLTYIVYAVLAIINNYNIQNGNSSSGIFPSLYATLTDASPLTFIMLVYEQIISICIHFGLATLTWYSAVKPGYTYLFFASVILRTIFNVPYALRDIAVIHNSAFLYIYISICALISLSIAANIYKSEKRNSSKLPTSIALF